MNTLREAITASATLSTVGTITEYLPEYAVLAYRFNEGLSGRIAGHPNDMFQVTLDNFYTYEPGSLSQVIGLLEAI